MAADPVAQLNELIARLRAASDPAIYAPVAADTLRDELEAQVALQRGPDGERWLPPAEGGDALSGAAANLQVSATGNVVIARVTGRYAYHHRGQTRGNVARPILPSRQLNRPAIKALQKALGDEFRDRLLEGGA